MRKGGGSVFFLLFFYWFVTAFLPAQTLAGEKGASFELAAGGGINLSSLNTNQAMLAPGLYLPVRFLEPVRVRVEGDVEVIDYRGRLTAIMGIAPFLRAVWPEGAVRPFVEIGGGVNYSSRNKIDGKKLRGPVLFSAMGGAGLEFSLNKRIIGISYRARHLSNGHLYKANQGLDSQYIMLSVRF